VVSFRRKLPAAAVSHVAGMSIDAILNLADTLNSVVISRYTIL